MALLREVRTGFGRRVDELKGVGHESSVELAESELGQVAEAYRLLDMVFEGFADKRAVTRFFLVRSFRGVNTGRRRFLC